MERSPTIGSEKPFDEALSGTRSDVDTARKATQPRDAQVGLPPIPTGIQRLLRYAKENDQFRTLLLEKRAEVASAAQVQLSASEIAILKAVPSNQLEAMIGCVPPSVPDRREFLRQSAASAVVLLGGAALSTELLGCDKTRPDRSRMLEVGGAAPDMPPARDDMTPDGGENGNNGSGDSDDEPIDIRPDHHHMAPGGARPDFDDEKK